MSDATVQSADPSQPYGLDGEAEPRRWHLVFGILCAVYGGIGTLFYSFAFLVILFSPLLTKWFGRSMGTPPELYWINLAGTFFPLCLGVLLLVGGIALARRKPRGYKLVVGWAVARIALAIVQVAVSIVTLDMTVKAQIDQYDAQMAQLSPAEREKAEKAMQSMGFPLPTYESARASAPKWIAIMTGAMALWPLIVGIALTGKRARDDYASWKSTPS